MRRIDRLPPILSTPTEWAWAAGIFEGEGSIVRHMSSHTRLSMSMNDEDVIRRFQTITGGKVYGPYRHKPSASGRIYPPHWTWVVQGVGGTHQREIIAKFWPWLGERRKSRAYDLGLSPD